VLQLMGKGDQVRILPMVSEGRSKVLLVSRD
jgi:hypothetical protein